MWKTALEGWAKLIVFQLQIPGCRETAGHLRLGFGTFIWLLIPGPLKNVGDAEKCGSFQSQPFAICMCKVM